MIELVDFTPKLGMIESQSSVDDKAHYSTI